MFRILLLGIFFITISVNSQSTLDVIRASNYYSIAMDNYSNKNYKKALDNLKKSETNLKGNTNEDLEFLKIMTLFKLSKYKDAYNLIVDFFENKSGKSNIDYKNITTYKDKNEIKYSETLTNIFIELENKYTIVSNFNEDEVIDSLVKKINSSLSKNSFENLVYPKLVNSIGQSYQLQAGKKEFRTPYVYVAKKSYAKTKADKFEVLYQISEIIDLQGYNWKAENQKDKVVLEYHRKSNLSKTSFKYHYVEESRSTRFYLPSTQDSGTKEYTNLTNYRLFRNKDFGLKISNTLSINFTTEETTILEQEGMLDKLIKALKKENLI